MKSLSAISGNRQRDMYKVWSKLPQIVDNGVMQQLSKNEIKISEMKFSILITEVHYNKELKELLKVFRASVSLNDELPLYNRRHMILLIKRYEILQRAERTWMNQHESVCFNPDLILRLLDNASSTSYAMACIAYVDLLDEMRGLIKRNAEKKDLFTTMYSGRINCEKILAPLHRLASLRVTMRKICNEEVNPTKLQIITQSLDNISGILDRCYEVLSSLHGSNYVADLDNLLDFSMKLMSLKLNDKTEGSTSCNLKELPSIDTVKNILLEQKDSSNIWMNDLQKNNHMHTLSGLSVNTTTSTLTSSSSASSSSFTNNHNQSGKEHSDKDMHDFVEIPLNQDKDESIDNRNIEGCETDNHDTAKECDENCKAHVIQIITPSPDDEDLTEEHLYEEIGNVIEKKHVLVLDDLKIFYWKDIPSVKESGVLKQLSEAELSERQAKYNIISTEYHYVQTLKNCLETFYYSPDIIKSIAKFDYKQLFGNYGEVTKCAENFLEDLFACLKEDINLGDISNIIRTHAVTCFQVYVTYCCQYPGRIRLLNRLLRENLDFRKAMIQKETDYDRIGRKLQSLLLMPCQRVTRLPFLVHNILEKVIDDENQANETQLAMNALVKLANECDEAVRTALTQRGMRAAADDNCCCAIMYNYGPNRRRTIQSTGVFRI